MLIGKRQKSLSKLIRKLHKLPNFFSWAGSKWEIPGGKNEPIYSSWLANQHSDHDLLHLAHGHYQLGNM